MSIACQILHERLSNPPRFSLDAPSTDNGIYVVFERGENAHGTDRIVHIGANTSDGGLLRRINYIYKSKKDLNIFRKHIGAAILKKRDDPLLEYWEASRGKIGFENQKEIEKEVSDYIKRNITFAIIPVLDVEEREQLKSMLLSTIKACTDCTPSKNWLGAHHSNSMINNSGLWNIRGYAKTTLSSKDVEALDIQTNQDMFLPAKENLPLFKNHALLLDDEITEINDELKTLIASAPEPKTAPTFALGDDNHFHITPPPDNQPVNSQDVLLKRLRETIEALLESRIGANAHLELTPIIEEYKKTISGEQISISQLYWSGIRLGDAARIIKRGIEAKEQPSLPFNTELNLDSALKINSNYIMSNAEGRRLVQDAADYSQSVKQTEALKQASEQLADSVAENQDLFGADVREYVPNVLRGIGKGQYQERSNQSAGNTLTNLVSSVFIATGTFAAMTIIGGAVVASGPGMAASALGAEAINAAGFFLVNNAHLLLMLAAPLAGEQSWLASAVHLLERIRLMFKKITNN